MKLIFRKGLRIWTFGYDIECEPKELDELPKITEELNKLVRKLEIENQKQHQEKTHKV